MAASLGMAWEAALLATPPTHREHRGTTRYQTLQGETGSQLWCPLFKYSAAARQVERHGEVVSSFYSTRRVAEWCMTTQVEETGCI